MKESYKEGVANHLGLGPNAVDGDIGGAALGGGSVGQLLSSEIKPFACQSCPDKEKAKPSSPLQCEVKDGRGGVKDPEHAWTFQAREPGDPIGVSNQAWRITRDENGQRTSRTVLLTRSLMGSQMSCYYQ